MAKTLKQVLDQISKLQRQADQIRSKEVSEVVQRIRVAIDHYGLSTQDLFGPKRRGLAQTAAAAAQRGPASTKRASIAKFASDDGRTWTGIGKRPTWFVEALAAGKTAQELLIDPSLASAPTSAPGKRAKKSAGADLVGTAGRSRNAGSAVKTARTARTPRDAKTGGAAKGRKASRSSQSSKTPGAPKYHDGAGKTWTGVGKRPSWFVEALAAGRQAEDLLIPTAAE
jgi:DNA-binding protein H-NS